MNTQAVLLFGLGYVYYWNKTKKALRFLEVLNFVVGANGIEPLTFCL